MYRDKTFFEDNIRYGCREERRGEERRELDETRLRRGFGCKQERREKRIRPQIQLKRNRPARTLASCTRRTVISPYVVSA
jgi:hypothetical protein